MFHEGRAAFVGFEPAQRWTPEQVLDDGVLSDDVQLMAVCRFVHHYDSAMQDRC